jgi:galactose mutarotase-like enzyme
MSSKGQRRGWETVTLQSDTLAVTVVPAKGGDLISVRYRPTDLELLWTSPWGLRERGAAPAVADDLGTYMEGYPGGWNTIFPNGGDPVVEHGVRWGMHGEVYSTPFDYELDGETLTMHTVLIRSPFEVTKRVEVAGSRVEITETITNRGGEVIEAMWSHHPAFGAPFLDGSCVISTGAKTFVADDERDTASGDLRIGATGPWPLVAGRGDATVDVSRMPPPGAGIDRMGYLTDFEEPWVEIANPTVGVAARLDWDASVFPNAWYWLEANGQTGFPWYQRAYVVAVEPASSYPGQGLHAVRAKTGNQLSFRPGETRTATVAMTVGPSRGASGR